MASARPTVVLVHGLGRDPSDWAPVARVLAPRVGALLNLDVPGLRDERPDPAAVGATLARTVAGRVGDSAVVWIGHSLGGHVVVEAARQAAPRVAGVVLVNSLPSARVVKSLRLPCVLVWARDDTMLSSAAESWCADAGARSVALAGGGHTPSLGEHAPFCAFVLGDLVADFTPSGPIGR